MTPEALPNPAGGYTALVQFHNDRWLTPSWAVFATAAEAREVAAQWIRDAIAAHARSLADAGPHLRLVDA